MIVITITITDSNKCNLSCDNDILIDEREVTMKKPRQLVLPPSMNIAMIIVSCDNDNH